MTILVKPLEAKVETLDYFVLSKGVDFWNRWMITTYLSGSDRTKKTLLKFLNDINKDVIKIEDASIQQIISIQPFSKKEIDELHIEVKGISPNKFRINNNEDIVSLLPCWSKVHDFGKCKIYSSNKTPIANMSKILFFNRSIFDKSDICAITNFSNCLFIKGASFKETKFRFSIDFKYSRFLEKTTFQGSTFEEYAVFRNSHFFDEVKVSECKFYKHTSFSEIISKGVFTSYDSKFLDDISFYNSTFNKLLFDDTVFSKITNFSEVTISNTVSFNNCIFKNSTRFFKTKFSVPPNFHNAAIHQDTDLSFSIFLEDYKKYPLYENSLYENSWRTLKHAMNKCHNHEQELFFFKKEMDCKIDRLKESNDKGWILLYLYKVFGNYGSSVIRPILSMISTIVLFGFLFSFLSSCLCLETGFKISMSNTFPLTQISQIYLKELNELKNSDFIFKWLFYLQFIFTTIWYFLIGVAIKNKLTIK